MIDFEKIQALLAAGRIPEAADELIHQITGSDKLKNEYNLAVLLKSRIKRLRDNFTAGIINREDYNLGQNDIELRIITLISDIKNKIPIENPEINLDSEKSKKDHKRLIEAIKIAEIGIWEWTKKREYHSPIWKQMLGYSQDDFEEETTTVWENILHPDDKQRAINDFRSFLSGARNYYESNFRLKCEDGSYKHILSKAKIVSSSEKGNIKRIVGIHQNIDKLAFEVIRRVSLNDQHEELKKSYDHLFEEKRKLLEAFEDNFMVLEDILNRITNLQEEIKHQVNPILETISHMEHILRLINNSYTANISSSAPSFKDFELESAINALMTKLKPILENKNKVLLPANFKNIQDSVLRGHFSQLKSVVYWFIQFGARNLETEKLLLEVEQLPQKSNHQTEVLFKMSIKCDPFQVFEKQKLEDLEDFIHLGHRRSKFINEEILNGLSQVVNMIKLISGKIVVDPDFKESPTGLHIIFSFQK